MKNHPIRIVITGPESSGKSTLARELALHYKTVWVEEYAREYIGNLRRDYNYSDILEIAKGQISRENELADKANKFLICDTGLLVPKIWCDVKYGKYHKWISEKIENHKYDLYLLCDIDIEWQFDILREHPQKRNELFHLFLNELNIRNLPFKVIRGTGDLRIQNAISIIDSMFVKK